MDSTAALIVVPNLLAFSTASWLAYKVHRGKRTEHRMAMAVCFAFVAINALVLLGEKLSADIATASAMVLLEYACETIILTALLVFVVQYVGMGRLIRPWTVFLAGAPGLAVVLLNATNDWHGLYYTSIVVVERHGFYMFEAEYGPLFLLWMAYFLAVVIISIVLMAKALTEAPADRRGGMWALTLAIIFIMVTGVAYVLSARNDPLVDVMSIGLTVSALTMFMGERFSEFTNVQIIRFREALADMEDAVLIVDPNLNVTFANAAGRRLLDQNGDFIRDRLEAREVKVPVGSHKWETAMSLDGQPRHYILSTSDIERDGKAIGAVLTFHDISDRKALEEDIKRANRSLSTLNQVLRHDLRNDLTSLWGYLDLLAETELTERQGALVRKMADRAKSADSHLAFAKDRQESSTAVTSWQGLQEVAEGALKQVDLDGAAAQVSLHGIFVRADPMLKNVFHSLADNSVRHGGGVRRVTVRAMDVEEGLNIIWEDDGVGIPREEKEGIFEEGVGRNSGLGLYLARNILSVTGFSISEVGTPGQGARFIIHIPSGWYVRKKGAAV